MQHTVILALATMLAIVAVVLIFLLWRHYERSVWRRRWQGVGTMGWTRASSRPADLPGDPPAAPPAHQRAPVPPSPGNDQSSGQTQRAALFGAGTATAATLHHCGPALQQRQIAWPRRITATRPPGP